MTGFWTPVHSVTCISHTATGMGVGRQSKRMDIDARHSGVRPTNGEEQRHARVLQPLGDQNPGPRVCAAQPSLVQSERLQRPGKGAL